MAQLVRLRLAVVKAASSRMVKVYALDGRFSGGAPQAPKGAERGVDRRDALLSSSSRRERADRLPDKLVKTDSGQANVYKRAEPASTPNRRCTAAELHSCRPGHRREGHVPCAKEAARPPDCCVPTFARRDAPGPQAPELPVFITVASGETLFLMAGPGRMV